MFIVGGNGSGKSTLLRVLTGLYPVHGGELRVDHVPVTPESVAAYRALFSAILSDFHLFDRLYGLEDVPADLIARLLREMELDHKVGVADGRFSTLDLSHGQKKRLALIVALLEDRPVLVFDEWAADQDPGFRRHFYEDILPGLKREGRTVIAATHDDRYFTPPIACSRWRTASSSRRPHDASSDRRCICVRHWRRGPRRGADRRPGVDALPGCARGAGRGQPRRRGRRLHRARRRLGGYHHRQPRAVGGAGGRRRRDAAGLPRPVAVGDPLEPAGGRGRVLLRRVRRRPRRVLAAAQRQSRRIPTTRARPAAPRSAWSRSASRPRSWATSTPTGGPTRSRRRAWTRR